VLWIGTKLVTLNHDLEQRNGFTLRLLRRMPTTSKWLKVDPYCLRRKCGPI